MKHFVLKTLFVFLVLMQIEAHAQIAKPAFLYGHISSDEDTIKLRLFFFRDMILGEGGSDCQIFPIHLNKSGNFFLRLPEIDHFARIVVEDEFSSTALFPSELQIIEPGDSVHMDVKVKNKNSPSLFSGEFSGKGAEKFNIVQNLKNSCDQFLSIIYRPSYKITDLVHTLDSTRKTQFEALKHFQSKLSSEAFALLKTDIYGSLLYSAVSFSSGNKPVFQRLREYVQHDTLDYSLIAHSPLFTKYFYYSEKCELAYSKNDSINPYKDLDNIDFNEFYFRLKNNFTGLFREKLLAFIILDDNSLKFVGSDPDIYLKCLSDALSIVHTPWLRGPLINLKKTRVKGAMAFNFSLPADSTGRIISLSDFKGKVLLIDMWGYQCTSCYAFAQIFHEKVFPLFRNNPNFKVISILVSDNTPMSSYLQRLRTRKNTFDAPVYTFIDYVNLFGGKGVEMARRMNQYYQFTMFPYILLIDKNGKIASSTIPLFMDPNSPSVDKLIDLIERTINAS